MSTEGNVYGGNLFDIRNKDTEVVTDVSIVVRVGDTKEETVFFMDKAKTEKRKNGVKTILTFFTVVRAESSVAVRVHDMASLVD